MARTKPGSSSKCKAVGCQGDAEETLCHALFTCNANDRVGNRLLEGLQQVQHGLGAEAALRLELQVGEADELPVVWVLATTLRILWNKRQSSTKVNQYVIRSQLEAEVNLLRETRHRESVAKIRDLTASMFNID